MDAMNKAIAHYTLSNGLTVLVRPTHTIPKVSVQLFYNVGSKHEKSGQRGLAHLIEHMIFKGTQKLSESDINIITHKLSGYCNAFTSYDYTGYMFDFPTHHWEVALELLSDCMRNCTFKQEHLNSEMKAVIQELKMYNDDYSSSLIEAMISAIFTDHPYHYPIIGFKQDLWSVSSKHLYDFYQRHYVPNNATLVVAGDVDPDQVVKDAEKYFGSIQADPNYKQESRYCSRDLQAKLVTLAREVKQSHAAYAFVIPGASEKKDHLFQVLAWILGSGNASRLYKKLVDEEQLVINIEAFSYDLVDRGLFFVYYQPKNQEDIPKINKLISEAIADIKAGNITEEELERAINQAEADKLAVLESIQKQAYEIGKSYVATNDPEYPFYSFVDNKDEIKTDLIVELNEWFSSSVVHTGSVLPLTKEDTSLWQKVQECSDAEDARIMSQSTRDVPIEPGKFAQTVSKKESPPFSFAQAQEMALDNGLEVSYYHNPNVAKVHFSLSLPAKYYHDSDQLQGLYSFVSSMITEGSKNYAQQELMHAFERHGMEVQVTPGSVELECLKGDVPLAVSLLKELICYSTMPEASLEKVRTRLIATLDSFWDEPTKLAGYFAKKAVYAQHPYSKLVLGSKESLQKITQHDLISGYKQWFTPVGAHLAIVGDIEGYDIPALVKEHLSDWQGAKIQDPTFPTILTPGQEHINHVMNRDQTVLAYTSPSIARTDKRYDALLLFDQIFTGGAVGSMSSRLFALREQSGLFYTIGGSLIHNVSKQPGMLFIRTIVSNDRLKEAEQAIMNTIAEAHTKLDDHELVEARDAIVQNMISNFESNAAIAHAFLFKKRYNLPDDYFDRRSEQLAAINVQQVKEAVQEVVRADDLISIKVGRV